MQPVSVLPVGMSQPKRRKQGRLPWSEEKARRALALPPGPQSSDELADWPLQICESLCGHNREDEGVSLRLKTHLTSGIVMYTDYSGMECPREALCLGILGLIQHHAWSFDSFPVQHSRMCGKDPLCLAVLDAIGQKDDSCVFENILDRLPTEAQEWICAATPAKTASSDIRRAAFANIRAWIWNHLDWLFPPDASCWCRTHSQHCKVFPECADEPLSSRPLIATCVGVSCLPWTAEGSQQGESSDCEIPHSVWVAERHVRGSLGKEDVAFVECTPRYPFKEIFQAELSDTHECVFVKVGPELLGWPHKRMRLLGAGLCRRTVQWMGPDSDQDIQNDFSDRFHRAVAITGEVFCVAPDSDVLAEYIDRARKQTNHVNEDDVRYLLEFSRDELLRLVLPPGPVQRFHAWMSECKESDTGSLGGACFLMSITTRKAKVHQQEVICLCAFDMAQCSWSKTMTLEPFDW